MPAQAGWRRTIRPARCGPSSWLAADQEHCRVIIERVADVAQHVGTQVVQDLVGVAGLAEGAGPGEREELAGPVPRLADAVGIEQDPVTRPDLDHGRLARLAGLARPGRALR